jgi:hypothetical protein
MQILFATNMLTGKKRTKMKKDNFLSKGEGHPNSLRLTYEIYWHFFCL